MLLPVLSHKTSWISGTRIYRLPNKLFCLLISTLRMFAFPWFILFKDPEPSPDAPFLIEVSLPFKSCLLALSKAVLSCTHLTWARRHLTMPPTPSPMGTPHLFFRLMIPTLVIVFLSINTNLVSVVDFMIVSYRRCLFLIRCFLVVLEWSTWNIRRSGNVWSMVSTNMYHTLYNITHYTFFTINPPGRCT